MQGHPNPVVVVLQVGMVIGRLGLLGDPIDEGDGVLERGKPVLLEELAPVAAPPGEVPPLQLAPDLFFAEAGHPCDSCSTVARAFSRTSRPSDRRPSSIDRGGRSRITLSWVPALRTITPWR